MPNEAHAGVVFHFHAPVLVLKIGEVVTMRDLSRGRGHAIIMCAHPFVALPLGWELYEPVAVADGRNAVGAKLCVKHFGFLSVFYIAKARRRGGWPRNQEPRRAGHRSVRGPALREAHPPQARRPSFPVSPRYPFVNLSRVGGSLFGRSLCLLLYSYGYMNQ